MMTIPTTATFTFAMLFVSLSATARAEDPTQYFCTVDASTGFYFRDGEWGTTNFKNREKYLLKEIDATRAGPSWLAGDKIWQLTEIGTDYALALCSDWWTGLDEKRERISMVRCDGLTKMNFNKRTLRFLTSYFIGYIDGVDKNDNTPSLSIGKCSPL